MILLFFLQIPVRVKGKGSADPVSCGVLIRLPHAVIGVGHLYPARSVDGIPVADQVERVATGGGMPGLSGTCSPLGGIALAFCCVLCSGRSTQDTVAGLRDA